ncbi:MAG: hypothetical protein H6874_10390 [Hyphomicrobiaceae bacterium]|nr:hypothetical protein [Hyphomicrobiaceae bacterium]
MALPWFRGTGEVPSDPSQPGHAGPDDQPDGTFGAVQTWLDLAQPSKLNLGNDEKATAHGKKTRGHVGGARAIHLYTPRMHFGW